MVSECCHRLADDSAVLVVQGGWFCCRARKRLQCGPFLVSNHSVIVFVCEGISSHFPTLKTFGDGHLCVCVFSADVVVDTCLATRYNLG